MTAIEPVKDNIVDKEVSHLAEETSPLSELSSSSSPFQLKSEIKDSEQMTIDTEANSTIISTNTNTNNLDNTRITRNTSRSKSIVSDQSSELSDLDSETETVRMYTDRKSELNKLSRDKNDTIQLDEEEIGNNTLIKEGLTEDFSSMKDIDLDTSVDGVELSRIVHELKNEVKKPVIQEVEVEIKSSKRKPEDDESDQHKRRKIDDGIEGSETNISHSTTNSAFTDVVNEDKVYIEPGVTNEINKLSDGEAAKITEEEEADVEKEKEEKEGERKVDKIKDDGKVKEDKDEDKDEVKIKEKNDDKEKDEDIDRNQDKDRDQDENENKDQEDEEKLRIIKKAGKEDGSNSKPIEVFTSIDESQIDAEADAESEEAENEDNDEDEDNNNDETTVKLLENQNYDELEKIKLKQKADAVKVLTEIEVEFAQLRDRLYEDKMARFQSELEMCSNGTHPELKAVYTKIDDHRNEKIRLASLNKKYKLQTIERRTRASRTAVHQQFIKSVSDFRTKYVKRITEDWYKINKERRTMDIVVPEYSYKRPEYTEDAVEQRAQLNQEISILTGLNQYYGFPKAPRLSSVEESELDEDLKAMNIL
ncbi:hypothetical protein WICMUC_001433 [Wickerhamomyces mucosus]|uniref:Transcriptional regulatory protein DEP1 n=1 Tax=Wickerhamomyces mucosus TaxID=1378264 RepID=A0A9P8PU85_9ASCO|nr:hypothetical protein WICMUC_001433 [Wickerhamomyces mucosus]